MCLFISILLHRKESYDKKKTMKLTIRKALLVNNIIYKERERNNYLVEHGVDRLCSLSNSLLFVDRRKRVFVYVSVFAALCSLFVVVVVNF